MVLPEKVLLRLFWIQELMHILTCLFQSRKYFSFRMWGAIEEVPLLIMGMGPMSVELSHQEDGLEMGVESGLRRKAVL